MKKENFNINSANIKEETDFIDDSNISIHTMQDDFDTLRGVFSEQRKGIIKENSGEKKSGNNDSKEDKKDQYFNPFLDSSSQNPENNVLENDELSENINTKNPNTNSNEESRNVHKQGGKIIWILISLIIIFAFSSGGYYLWSTRKTLDNDVNPPIVETKTEENKKAEQAENDANKKEENNTEIKTIEKYSSEKANYLSINTIDPSPENLKATFLKVGEEIKNSTSKKPIEFIITDEKNNPVSFPAFCVLSGIKFSSDLLKDLNNNFSLYFYSDSGNIRLGIAISAKEKEKLSPIVKKEELNLIQELAPLFLEKVITTKEKVVFEDNNYSGIAIRYFNLDEKMTYSIDYAFIGDQLIFATSKNTTWAILDKINSGGK